MKVLVLVFIFFSSFVCVNGQDSLHSSTSNELTNFLQAQFEFVKDENLIKNDKRIFLKNNNHTQSVFFLVILNLIFVTVLLLQISKTKIIAQLKTVFSVNALYHFANIENKRNNLHLVAYFILISIYFVLLLMLYNTKMNLEIDVVFLTLSTIKLLIFNFVYNYLLAFVLNKENLITLNLFNNTTFTIILLPFLITVSLLTVVINSEFVHLFFTVVFAIVLIVFLLQEIRNVIIFKSNKIKVSSFYFFLYLCTLKILPFMVFFKIVFDELSK